MVARNGTPVKGGVPVPRSIVQVPEIVETFGAVCVPPVALASTLITCGGAPSTLTPMRLIARCPSAAPSAAVMTPLAICSPPSGTPLNEVPLGYVPCADAVVDVSAYAEPAIASTAI